MTILIWCRVTFRGPTVQYIGKKVTKLAGILKRTTDSIYAQWKQSENTLLHNLINIFIRRQSFWPGISCRYMNADAPRIRHTPSYIYWYV